MLIFPKSCLEAPASEHRKMAPYPLPHTGETGGHFLLRRNHQSGKRCAVPTVAGLSLQHEPEHRAGAHCYQGQAAQRQCHPAPGMTGTLPCGVCTCSRKFHCTT
jgi:hypothetical protein